MHKGREYELDNSLRVYSSQVGYPRWIAKSYSIQVVTGVAWVPATPVPGPGYTGLTLYDPTLSSPNAIAFSTVQGTQAGREIKWGMIGQWSNAQHTTYDMYNMIWADGVEQLQRDIPMNLHDGWRWLRRLTLANQVTGAVCYTRSSCHHIAVPW